jgi:hypothetical protein
MTVTRPGLVLLLLLLAAAAPAPARAHGWYTGLRDGTGRSCCDDRDCRPVGLCVLPDGKQGLLIAQPDGKQGLLIAGACVPIPWDKVLGVASPDGGAHACWQPVGRPPSLRCVILPGEV